MSAGSQRLLLVHNSDLFYSSGTAVIYRRLLALLPREFEVWHYVGHWRSANEATLRRRYAEETRIAPIFSKWGGLLDFYGRISRRFNHGVPDYRLAGVIDGLAIRNVLKRLRPALVWWSGDYLPRSVSALGMIRTKDLRGSGLHFSLYDPPGFWNAGRYNFMPAFQNAVRRANGVDVIGENMRILACDHGAADPVILNDYLEREPACEQDQGDRLSIAIAGQIYGTGELQALLNAVGALPDGGRVVWFGSPQQHRTAERVKWPENVVLERHSQCRREELPGRIASLSAGYLTLPADREEFSRYSIPTKLVTYLEAGVPVLFHAPENSEIDKMNQDARFGCNLSHTHDIPAALTSFRSRRPEWQAGVRQLALKRYQQEDLRRRLIKYFGQS